MYKAWGLIYISLQELLPLAEHAQTWRIVLGASAWQAHFLIELEGTVNFEGFILAPEENLILKILAF